MDQTEKNFLNDIDMSIEIIKKDKDGKIIEKEEVE